MYISLEVLLKICAGFASICVAAGWLIRIIKALRRPSDDINAKLDRDNRRIIALEDDSKYLRSAVTMLIQDDRVILNHLRTQNSTGEIEKRENAIDEFLLNRP